jgi:ABC-type nitrate/sulfonate/bicarbonate transport system ATPase subunit
MTTLQGQSITKSYEGIIILQDVNVHLEQGELVCLIGLSGSGKTTLFNILSGLELPDSGLVLLNGRDITGKPGQISYMLQKDLLLPHKKTIDNVALPLLIRGCDKQEAREKAKHFLPQFGLEGTEDKYPCQLSGGMRQRAALLRTYLASSGMALLDEPFSALDAITKRALHQWYLGVMQQLGLTTLFITHDIDEAILLSHRIYVLAAGGIAAEFMIKENQKRNPEFALSPAFLDYKREILMHIGI